MAGLVSGPSPAVLVVPSGTSEEVILLQGLLLWAQAHCFLDGPSKNLLSPTLALPHQNGGWALREHTGQQGQERGRAAKWSGGARMEVALLPSPADLVRESPTSSFSNSSFQSIKSVSNSTLSSEHAGTFHELSVTGGAHAPWGPWALKTPSSLLLDKQPGSTSARPCGLRG